MYLFVGFTGVKRHYKIGNNLNMYENQIDYAFIGKVLLDTNFISSLFIHHERKPSFSYPCCTREYFISS